MNSNRFAGRTWWQSAAAPLVLLFMAGAAIAAATDVANAPLFTSSNSSVKPNIMFVLDDSGSMAWDFLPDDADFSSTKYGKLTSQCNGVAYNPAIIYKLPVSSTGVALTAGSVAAITNPATQTSNPRTLSAIASMPASATGSMSVTVTASNPGSSWFPIGSTVTIYNSGDSTRYIVGTVTNWNTSSGALQIGLTGGAVVGTGAMANPRAANGGPATYYSYSGTQKALGYTYSSGGVITSTTFYKECDSAIGSSPGAAVFTHVTVTPNSAEVQNYANWYQYYRTRIDMMQSSISLAFSTLDSRYRIGFSTISQTSAAAGTEFLDIADFAATQKDSFYTAVNAASPGNSTPLRGALSKAGQYFANKARGQAVDPVQYSCQRNFTILSTDGYWNTGDEHTSSPKYGPYQIDNTTNVGEQDAYPTKRPMLDGSTVQSTTTETWTTTAVTTATTTTPQTTVATSATTATSYVPTTGYQQYVYTYNKSKKTCSAQRQTRDLLTFGTTTTTNSTTTLSTLTSIRTQTDTTRYSRVTITVNGSLVSDTGPQGTLLTPSISTSTSTVAQPSTTAVDPVTTSGTTYTAWVNSGSPTSTSGNCPPSPSAAAPIAPTTTAYGTTSGPTPGGPTTTPGTSTTVTSAPVNSESAHVTRTSTTTSNGTSDTLADIAAYYYNTDLRTSALSNCTGALGSDVCEDNVPGESSDAAHSYGDSVAWQHMTTFTLGLGVSGLLTYDPNYLTQRAGDFYDITNGQKNWPVPGGSKSAENIDDLWHAAVNGHGQYFSAGDPQALSASLTSALASIKATTGAAAAASTSSLQPVQGDNDIYVAQFTSVKWIGDLLSYKIDPTSGAISTAITWSAKTQLDAMAPSSRTIYYSDPAGGATLRPFTYASLMADSYGSYFDGFCSKTGASGARGTRLSAPA